jgi:ABC-2 type transport system ATP-binding protein
MQEDIAIKVENVSKSFELAHEKNLTLKARFINILKGKKRRTTEKQRALKNISFEVKKGEFFGIVGRNGSGKSTLLKILAEIYQPTKGDVTVHGKLVPFIELGVGFNPELTGRENVYLNGAILGFSKKEIDAFYDEVVEFAELGQYMDKKLKNYSSGMQVRLAFSMAIRAKADILLIDEVLAVGDEAFQKKCYQYFAEIKREKMTVILVTHSMDVIQQFCNKAMLIDKSHKTVIGTPHKIAQIYSELNDQEGVTVNETKEYAATGTKYVNAKVDFKDHGEELEFDINITPKRDLEDPIVALEVFSDNGEQLIRWVTDEKIDDPIVLAKGPGLNMKIFLQNIFPVGNFSVRLLLRKRDRSVDYGVFNDIAKFEVKNNTTYKHNVHWKPRERVVLNLLK